MTPIQSISNRHWQGLNGGLSYEQEVRLKEIFYTI